jgi:hypothetical protein
METELIKLFTDTGATIGALLACFWYIRWKDIQNAEEKKLAAAERESMKKEALEERRMWVQKDTESDKQILELQRSTYSSLMEIMQSNTSALKDLHGALIELRASILEDRKR